MLISILFYLIKKLHAFIMGLFIFFKTKKGDNSEDPYTENGFGKVP